MSTAERGLAHHVVIKPGLFFAIQSAAVAAYFRATDEASASGRAVWEHRYDDGALPKAWKNLDKRRHRVRLLDAFMVGVLGGADPREPLTVDRAHFKALRIVVNVATEETNAELAGLVQKGATEPDTDPGLVTHYGEILSMLANLESAMRMVKRGAVWVDQRFGMKRLVPADSAQAREILAEGARGEGYARMATVAADALGKIPGHDEDGRTTFEAYERLFTECANANGVTVSTGDDVPASWPANWDADSVALASAAAGMEGACLLPDVSEETIADLKQMASHLKRAAGGAA